jgi:hypothetical protein
MNPFTPPSAGRKRWTIPGQASDARRSSQGGPHWVRRRGHGVALLLLVIAGGALCGCRAPRVMIDKDEVLYKGTATEQDAKALGDALKKVGFFKGRGVSVQLTKGPDGAIITFVVQEGAWDDAGHVAQFESITRGVASAVGGLPVKLRLADENLSTKKETTVNPPVTIGAKDEIIYSDAATDMEAKSLGLALQTEGYLQDRGVTVLLSKGAGGTVISFPVKDGTWDEPDSVSAFERIGRAVAPSVGGPPIKVRLLNTELQSKKEIPIK